MAWRPTQWVRRNPVWRFYRISRLLFSTLWIIVRERNRVVRARANGQFEVTPNIDALKRALREFRLTAVALGGLLIKLGQFLSARADLLPPEALAELATLQDEVPAECFADIEATLERDLRRPLRDVFVSIDPVPAGSASLGQVHRAVLLDGRAVAVKVQRPGIHQIVRADLNAIHFVLRVTKRIFPAANDLTDLDGLYKEFSRTVYEELNYEREGHNAERFARLFANEPDILVPGVVWEHTTRRVLTLEWMDGIKINNVAQISAAGVSGDAVAQRLVGTYLKQVLDVGFFHADPHPGNIFVRPTRNGFELVFVDFGMMGSITRLMKEALRECLLGIVEQNPRLVVNGLEALGFIGANADRRAITEALGLLLGQYSNMAFGQMREVDPREVFGEIEELLYGQPFHLPAQFAFLGRALGMLLGLATALSPNFNALDTIAPYASQFTGNGATSNLLRMFGVESTGDLGRMLAREGVSAARSLALLPKLAERVLEQVERGELHVTVEGTEFGRQVSRSIARNAFMRPVPAWVPMGMAAAALATLVVRRLGNRE